MPIAPGALGPWAASCLLVASLVAATPLESRALNPRRAERSESWHRGFIVRGLARKKPEQVDAALNRRLANARDLYAAVVARETAEPGSGGEAGEALARYLLSHWRRFDPGASADPTPFWGPRAALEVGVCERGVGGESMARWCRVSAVEGGAKVLRVGMTVPGRLAEVFDGLDRGLREIQWAKRLGFLPAPARDAAFAVVSDVFPLQKTQTVVTAERAVISSAQHRALLRTLERLTGQRPDGVAASAGYCGTDWRRCQMARVEFQPRSARGRLHPAATGGEVWFEDPVSESVDTLVLIAFWDARFVPCLPLSDERKAARAMFLHPSGPCWIDGVSDVLSEALGIDR